MMMIDLRTHHQVILHFRSAESIRELIDEVVHGTTQWGGHW